jgi:hypothetical protein
MFNYQSTLLPLPASKSLLDSSPSLEQIERDLRFPLIQSVLPGVSFQCVNASVSMNHSPVPS